MKILSVDDKVENLYLIESMLRGADCGYQVVSAQNGLEALEKLEREKFDLIIADILMPEMDGFELCHEVKARESLRNIPFIFYTATYTERKDQELGLRLGASRFVIKPLEPDKFLAVIREAVEDFEAGRLVALPPATNNEEVLLKEYSRRLVRKLDRKVGQLAETAQKLNATIAEKEAEVAERQKAEAEVRRVNSELERRVRERTAELAAANQELENFASAVSHDLRAPLRAIEGFSQILSVGARDKLDDRSRGLLDKIQSETQRMTRLIEALLQLSRATRAELRHEEVNLSQLAREIETDLRREQPDRRVSFKIAPDLIASGDPALLRSVLRNLLGNAWKFTARCPEAHIEFGALNRQGKPVYYVFDNGAGFDMEAAAKLFAPFQRLHAPNEYAGTGMGLATVQRIVRRHGGQVCAEGAPGKGAKFYFTLQ